MMQSPLRVLPLIFTKSFRHLYVAALEARVSVLHLGPRKIPREQKKLCLGWRNVVQTLLHSRAASCLHAHVSKDKVSKKTPAVFKKATFDNCAVVG